MGHADAIRGQRNGMITAEDGQTAYGDRKGVCLLSSSGRRGRTRSSRAPGAPVLEPYSLLHSKLSLRPRLHYLGALFSSSQFAVKPQPWWVRLRFHGPASRFLKTGEIA